MIATRPAMSSNQQSQGYFPMKFAKLALLACSALGSSLVHAGEIDEAESAKSEIIVTGARSESMAGTKTDVPLIETPQPITVITDDVYLAQGALSVSDTLNYVAGVTANPYGPDSRVDGGVVRGVDPLQFRDGMRDLFSYYASIRSDPYNFSRVELVRGPASGLFGAGSLGGIINLVSKEPEDVFGGEIALRYGSFDRKEVLADLTGPLIDGLAGRIVVRARDSGTQTDFVPDDRVMIAPSLKWQAGANTSIALLGLYQEDDGGSTSQFLPLVGTILSNPNGQLANDTFIGKPGWDRYDGRLLEGTAIVDHSFSDKVKLSLKARYIDSDLTYLTHYPDSYSNPANPYVLLDPSTGAPVLDADGVSLPDPNQRTIGLYSDGSYARMNVFTTDNNLRADFNTGDAIRHILLAGVDYSWNRVRKTGGYGYEFIDIYDIDFDALSNYDGGLPPGAAPYEDTVQKQLGFYLQDQIRFWDRVSLVLGVRHDKASARSFGTKSYDDSATSFRAGVIGEILPGVSPFVSYTESFDPISGNASDGNPFVPKRGSQYEAGIKIHPDEATLVTATAYRIKERNRPVDDPDTPDPFDQKQVGSLTSKGFEIEATRMLPGNFEIIGNLSYVKAEVDGTGIQLDTVPKYNASLWTTKRVDLGHDVALRLGGGVRYTSASRSFGGAFPDGIRTPSYTIVDALAELSWQKWRFSINATNLFDKKYYAACLARGDCFIGAERQAFGTLTYSFR